MSAALIALFLGYEAICAIQAWHLKNVVMQQRYSMAAAVTGDITGGRVSFAYTLTAFFGRFNGIAFLIYVGWVYGWLSALMLWVGGLFSGMALNALLRSRSNYGGIWLVAHAAVVGVPVAGALIWWMALRAA